MFFSKKIDKYEFVQTREVPIDINKQEKCTN